MRVKGDAPIHEGVTTCISVVPYTKVGSTLPEPSRDRAEVKFSGKWKRTTASGSRCGGGRLRSHASSCAGSSPVRCCQCGWYSGVSRNVMCTPLLRSSRRKNMQVTAYELTPWEYASMANHKKVKQRQTQAQVPAPAPAQEGASTQAQAQCAIVNQGNAATGHTHTFSNSCDSVVGSSTARRTVVACAIPPQ